MYTKIQIEQVYVYQDTDRAGLCISRYRQRSVCIPRYRQRRFMYTKIPIEQVYVYQDTNREGV